MSNRTTQQLAAQALREGLDIFWPDREHWAQRAFYKPIEDGGRVIGQARCLEQLVAESARRFVGRPLSIVGGVMSINPAEVVLGDVARMAIIGAARGRFDPELHSPSGHMIVLNDEADATYEKVRGYVETAVRELEKAE